MNQNSNPDKEKEDLFWLISQLQDFHLEFRLFSEYLENLSSFLEKTKRDHVKSIDEINDKIKSGKITPPQDSGQMPPELEYDHHKLNQISSFEDTLFTSFFIALYSYFEGEFTKHCIKLDKHTKELAQKKQETVLRLADISKTKGVINRNMTFLIKARHINYSKNGVNKDEWERIINFSLLRNAVVHNQVDRSRNKDFLKFVNTPNSNLLNKNNHVVITKEFCLKALKTIEVFLDLVIATPSRSNK